MDTLPSMEKPGEVQPQPKVGAPVTRRRDLVPLLLAAVVPIYFAFSAPAILTDSSRKPPCTPSDVPAGLVARCLDSDRGFPLVVSPTDDSLASLDALASWMERDRAIVKQWLAIYGAVLFRGFESADGAAEFEKVAQHLADAPLADVYLGTSPRVPVAGTKHVFTASEFAPWKVVPPHCEMSFLPSPPHFIAFFAASIPSDLQGGETPLIDMRGSHSKWTLQCGKRLKTAVSATYGAASADSTHPPKCTTLKTKTGKKCCTRSPTSSSATVRSGGP